jgi:hypothetical protein
MKFRLRRPFSVQITPTRVKTFPIGEYDVPSEFSEEYARRAKAQHLGFFVPEKKAPENKVVKKVSESKKKVARKAVRRSSNGSESDE